MKIGFASLGCAKNLVDSEEIMGMLQANGHEIVSNPARADAVIVNTCGFINPAKEESIETIFDMLRKCSNVIVVGCLAQRYEKELREEIPEVKAVIPLHDYDRLPEILAPLLEQKIALKPYEKDDRALSGKPYSAYVKISDGCSNHCTYCAIPLIRGEQSSKFLSEVREEVEILASRGVSEITLIAQDTTKYGLDNYGRLMLGELIRQLDEIEGIHWIRILYMYPDEICDDVLQAMKESSKVVPYFDIPMQHANDRLLKKMNRRGTKEDALALIRKIRKMFPEATLRTTLIVGFPSETEDDFQELLDFVKEVGWDRLGAFTYSKEEDTAASTMQPEVEESVALDRLDRLMAVQKEISARKNLEKVNKVIEVLVEEREPLTGRYRGRTAADAPDEVDGQVIFTSDQELKAGMYVPIRIIDAAQYDLIGIYEG